MLLRFDEYPYHQITASFAGVAGSDPQWNDGHYVCLSDQAGQVCLTSSLRLYHNNDVLDGFVCLRHDGRQHNIRLSRRLRPHRTRRTGRRASPPFSSAANRSGPTGEVTDMYRESR